MLDPTLLCEYCKSIQFLTNNVLNTDIFYRFLSLEHHADTSFGCQISASQQDIKHLLHWWQISPLFTNMMLGQYTGNHLPAAESCSFAHNGQLRKLSEKVP